MLLFLFLNYILLVVFVVVVFLKAHTDIALKLKPDNLKRNHVQFWNGRDIITFIHKPEYIRIHISQQKKCDEKLYEVCPKLRNLVKNTVISITESMLNSLYTATSEERYKSHFQTYHFAFKCYKHSELDHLCVVSDEEMPETMNCVWDGNNTPFEMRAENLIWYGKVSLWSLYTRLAFHVSIMSSF